MRFLSIESTEYAFKKRRPKKSIDYETKDYCGGLSFVVKNGQMERWRMLLTLRYFVLFGSDTKADIKLHRKVDINNITLEEKFSINSLVLGTKSNKQLMITVYFTTDKILIQGHRKAEWMEKEMPAFRDLADNSDSTEEMVKHFDKKNGFNILETHNVNSVLREAELSANSVKIAERAIELAEKEVTEEENNPYLEDSGIIIDENQPTMRNSWLGSITKKKIKNKLVLASTLSPSKRAGRKVGKP